MNSLVADIFNRLRSATREGEQQQKALVQLLMLLDWALKRPQMDQKMCAVHLPRELLSFELSPRDIEEIFNEMARAMEEDQLPRSSKMSLFWMIAANADAKSAEIVLRFFSEHVDTFNEQEAFSSIAQVTRFLELFNPPVSHFQPLLIKFKILDHLKRFQTNLSPRLQRSAALLSDIVSSILNSG